MALQAALQKHSTQAVMRSHADPKEDLARCGARHLPRDPERTTTKYAACERAPLTRLPGLASHTDVRAERGSQARWGHWRRWERNTSFARLVSRAVLFTMVALWEPSRRVLCRLAASSAAGLRPRAVHP